MKYLDKSKSIHRSERIILILGQPGIGKTWFLSYVLVGGFWRGSPLFSSKAKTLTATQCSPWQLITSSTGMVSAKWTKNKSTPSYIRRTSVLADQKAFGVAQKAKYYQWLVVVTSSPQKTIISI